jgi:hypothetical protein
MAGVPVTIRGRMYRTGLGVGGGPAPGGPRPEHPIAPGGEPPGIWGGVPPEYVDIGGPGDQPYPDQGLPPFPSHPIVIPPEFIADVHPEHPIVIPPPPKPPLGFWGGTPPNYVDIGGPGPQPGPSHPIVIPPDIGIWPPDAKPEHPIVIPPPTTIWPPRPTHPIVLPPDGPPEVLDKWDVVAYWTPVSGWGVAIVPGEGHDAPIVTPSSGS